MYKRFEVNRLNYFLMACLVFFASSIIFSQSFEYVSPINNSKLVSLKTNIILRCDNNVDPTSLSQNEFSVTGSISGVHNGTVKLSDDNRTILFIPSVAFSANENVTVKVSSGIKTVNGNELPLVTINFKTTPLTQAIQVNPISLMEDGSAFKAMTAGNVYKSIAQTSSLNNLPSDFPKITIDSTNNPSDENIFLTNFAITPNDSIGNYLMILDNDGSVVKYKKIDEMATDFKVLTDGQLVYSNILTNYGEYATCNWIVMDTSLTPVDTFQCGNGYLADEHEFRLLPNGHALLFAYDPEPQDLSQYGGDADATVIGTIIQEIDASKNVVFQWRSWDAIPDTDSYMPLNTSTVDLIHANSMAIDSEGNILLSMRHLSSIIKINRQTGKIDWILGGKENQFTFIGEHAENAPNYFSFQHDIRFLPNGDLTLFDNGNQHSPNYSRGVEYRLDEINKTATLVWEYRHNPDIYSMAMGSVQRLSNGNTLIGWGYASSQGSPIITEVDSSNNVVLEMSLPAGQSSYRTYKFPWVSQTPEAKVTLTSLYQNNTYEFYSKTDTTGIKIKFDQINSSSAYPNFTVSRFNYSPVNPTFNTTAPKIYKNYFSMTQQGLKSYSADVQVDLQYYPAVTNPKATIIYARSNIDSNFVPLETTYDSTKNELTFSTSMTGDFAFGIPADTTLTSVKTSQENIVKSYQLSQNYPNPFNPSTVIEYSIPQESRVRIDIFNAIGQRVKTLVNSTQSKGNYSVSWNANGFASGIYFYAIKATSSSGRNFYSVKKMILLK